MSLDTSNMTSCKFTNRKACFQDSFPVHCVSGTSRKQFVMPDMRLRATQGHSIRNDAGLGYLIADQECLNLDQDDIPCFGLHGTDLTASSSIKESHSLIPGGLAGNRAAVHFVVSLRGVHGRIVFRIPNKFHHIHLLV